MAEATQVELISQALKATQQLRASVSQVFERLSNGMPKSANSQGSDKAFLAELQQNLMAVNRDLGFVTLFVYIEITKLYGVIMTKV